MSQIEVSLNNQDRLESNPNFDSIDETLTHVLDLYDDAWFCILSGEPKTEELIKLKERWGTFETSEFRKLAYNICLLLLKGKSDPTLENDVREAVNGAVEVFMKEHFQEVV